MSDTKITFDATVIKIGTTSCGCELYSNAVVLCPLHAAAPDLLAACENILGHIAERGSVKDDHLFACIKTEAITVIAKAKMVAD